VCGGHNFGWEMEPVTVKWWCITREKKNWAIPFPKVLHALWGEHIIVPLPRKLGLYISTWRQTLQCLDYLKVGNIQLFVFWCIEVFFSN
jgi:hypothetical protein